MTTLPTVWLLVWLLAPSAAIARIHFAHGQRLFQQHDYRRALDEFTTANEASPTEVPDLWFDIGQCHRNLGHARQATLAFEHYLALAPDAADRGKVQAMLAQLAGRPSTASAAADETFGPQLPPPDPALAAGPPSPSTATEPSAAMATPTAATLTASAPPASPSHRRRWIILGSVAGVVVVGALAVGLGVGLSGSHASSPMLGSGGTFDTRTH